MGASLEQELEEDCVPVSWLSTDKFLIILLLFTPVAPFGILSFPFYRADGAGGQHKQINGVGFMNSASRK